MGSLAAVRSVLRSSSVRISAAKFAAASAAKPKPASSPFRLPAAPRILRSPVESSFCVESLLPMHSATASALMTSMLAVTRGGYGWLSDARPRAFFHLTLQKVSVAYRPYPPWTRRY